MSGGTKRIGIAAGALVLVAVAGGLAWSRRERSSVERPTEVAPSAPPSFHHAFVPGRHLTYGIDHVSEGLIDGAMEARPVGEGTSPTAFGVASSVEGVLDTLVLERRPDGTASVLCTLRDLEIHLVVREKLPVPSATLAPLARGFVVEFLPDGRVVGLRMPEGASTVASRIAAQMVSFLQLVTEPGAAAQSWTTTERDVLGPLEATYRWESDAPTVPGGRIVSKTITRRAPAPTGGALGRLLSAGRTDGRADLAFEISPSRGEITYVAGALATEHVLGDLRVGSEDSTVVLELRAEETLSADDLAARVRAIAVGPARPIDPITQAEGDRRVEDERLLSQIDLPSVVADARAHPPAVQSAEAFTYSRILRAAIARGAEHRLRLEAILCEAGAPEHVLSPIVRAFADVGSPEAQASLRTVISRRKKDDPARELALFSLARVDAPTVESLRLLESVATDPADPWRDAALLGLGRAAGQCAAAGDAAGDAILGRLRARAASATDVEARVLALDALGNAAAASSAPVLEEALHAPQPSVRAAAARAFRLDPSPAARAILLGAMATDGDGAVRAAAMEAVLLRRPDDGIVDAVAARVETDDDEHVRKPALSRLLSLCRKSKRACAHAERLETTGDDWTRHELAGFRAASQP